MTTNTENNMTTTIAQAVTRLPDPFISLYFVPNAAALADSQFALCVKLHKEQKFPIVVADVDGDYQALDAREYLTRSFQQDDRLRNMIMGSSARHKMFANVQGIDGRVQVNLTLGEYLILDALMAKPGAVLSQSALELAISPTSRRPRVMGSNSIEVIVSRLRYKIRNAGGDATQLATVRGQGYMWVKTNFDGFPAMELGAAPLVVEEAKEEAKQNEARPSRQPSSGQSYVQDTHADYRNPNFGPRI